jgi:hypothetical protein
VKKLRECVEMFTRWEGSFNRAFGKLEQEFAPQLKRCDERE